MDIKATLEPYKAALPYMVMLVGIFSALLFIWYFAAETDDRKRKVADHRDRGDEQSNESILRRRGSE